jgi:hypothetical protein
VCEESLTTSQPFQIILHLQFVSSKPLYINILQSLQLQPSRTSREYLSALQTLPNTLYANCKPVYIHKPKTSRSRPSQMPEEYLSASHTPRTVERSLMYKPRVPQYITLPSRQTLRVYQPLPNHSSFALDKQYITSRHKSPRTKSRITSHTNTANRYQCLVIRPYLT